jgi:hypothetical protein
MGLQRVPNRELAGPTRAAAAAALVLVGVALLGFELGRRAWQHEPVAFPTEDRPAAAVPALPAEAPAERPVAAVAPAREVGSGIFSYAASEGPTHGATGALHRFRVAVEEGSGEDADRFAAAVDAVLGDPRSWAGTGRLRLQRVPAGAPTEFTLYLATPATSESMCAETGLQTRRYSSCRIPGKVIINSARWWSGVAAYGAGLDVYRAYVLNHEIGHQLGHGHERCPGPGRAAPVMQQQTLGLAGCVANGWPYP